MKMSTNTKFPAGLLEDTKEARLDFFKSWVAPHANMVKARRKALAAVQGRNGPSVVIVTGPTGVGKTTMANSIYDQLKIPTGRDTERKAMPALFVSAVAPEGNSFNWKDFYIRVLQAAAEPLIEDKIAVAHHQYSLFPGGHMESPLERVVPASLRRSVTQCLRHRGTIYLIVDEAHHMLMVSNPKRAQFPFEVIKSLAAECKIIIVLVGTYGLLDICEHSGQLARRSEIVHFPRYDVREESDMVMFKSTLKALSDKLPIKAPVNLENECEYFYHMTGGAIGILKDWLVKALRHYLDDESKKFDRGFIDQYAMTKKTMHMIIEEALVGEHKLEDISLSDLQALLEGGLPAISESATPKGKKVPAAAVAKPKPRRHQTGGAYA